MNPPGSATDTAVETSEREARAALAADPTNRKAQRQLGEILFITGRAQEALDMFVAAGLVRPALQNCLRHPEILEIAGDIGLGEAIILCRALLAANAREGTRLGLAIWTSGDAPSRKPIFLPLLNA